jgi:hypothetical protein
MSISDGREFVLPRPAELALPYRPGAPLREVRSSALPEKFACFWQNEWPTVLNSGSEIPPGVVRLLGATRNGGWRNPALCSGETGVAVLGAGKFWEDNVDGFVRSVRGPLVHAASEVRPWVDPDWVAFDPDEGLAPVGSRVTDELPGAPSLRLPWRLPSPGTYPRRRPIVCCGAQALRAGGAGSWAQGGSWRTCSTVERRSQTGSPSARGRSPLSPSARARRTERRADAERATQVVHT